MIGGIKASLFLSSLVSAARLNSPRRNSTRLFLSLIWYSSFYRLSAPLLDSARLSSPLFDSTHLFRQLACVSEVLSQPTIQLARSLL